MPSRRLRDLALVAGLLAAACAHVETRVVRLGPAAPARAENAPVTVLRPPLPPGATPAREVALVEVTSYEGEWSAGVVDALRRAARTVGADVVLWMREDRIEGFTRVIASAIRTRDAALTPPATPAPRSSP